jgi:hypothetical protein
VQAFLLTVPIGDQLQDFRRGAHGLALCRDRELKGFERTRVAQLLPFLGQCHAIDAKADFTR